MVRTEEATRKKIEKSAAGKGGFAGVDEVCASEVDRVGKSDMGECVVSWKTAYNAFSKLVFISRNPAPVFGRGMVSMV